MEGGGLESGVDAINGADAGGFNGSRMTGADVGGIGGPTMSNSATSSREADPRGDNPSRPEIP